MRQYKDTFVGEGSQLDLMLKAVAKKDLPVADAVRVSAPKRIYDETTERFFALYGEEDAKWFINKHKENV
jgi:hypothetical protein